MRTQLYINLVVIVAVSAMFSHATGFDIYTIKRALALASETHGEEPNKKVLAEMVGIALRLTDLNTDGVIGLDELESAIDQYISLVGGKPDDSHFRDPRNYALTIAAIIDSDQNGVLEREELDRLMSTYLSNLGEGAAAELLADELSFRMAVEDLEIPRGRKLVAMVYDALDRDGDDVITTEELRRVFGALHSWWDIEVLVQDADVNGDNRLTSFEVPDWVRMLRRHGDWELRQLFMYSEIKQKLGRDLADGWLQ